MRKPLIIFVTLLVAIFLGIGALYFWWSESTKPVSDSDKKVRIVITKGRSAAQVANDLYKNGVIRSPLAFKFYVQFKGKASDIQAGEFELSPNLSMFGVLDKLAQGPLQLWVTVPEGLRREEVVERFITGLEIEESKSSAFRKDFLDSSRNLEGFLFPDTYLFPRDITGANVVKRMHDLFDERVTKGLSEQIKTSKFSLEQIVTIASILEKETKNKDVNERPIVVGILMNRLDIGMGLQVDATVQYVIGAQNCQLKAPKCDWWPTLTKEDLQVNSPFNTYKFKGLPPAPIANPGLSTIKAALSPQKTDYLYYLHDKDGKIHYARTLSEHNENVRQYLTH